MEILGIIYIFIVAAGAVGIVFELPESYNTVTQKTFLLSAIHSFVKKLFLDKNLFGKVLSGLFLVGIVPSVIIVVAIQVLVWIALAVHYIWKLGNKR